MPLRHIGLILAISLFWGSNFVVAKYALLEMGPLLITTLRFVIVSSILFPFFKLHKDQLPLLVLVGLTAGAFNFGTFFLGLQYASASAAAVFIQLNAPFAVILSVIFLGEHLNRHNIIGLALAFGGVMVLSFDPGVFQYVLGLTMVTLCALFVAISNVLMKKLKGVGVLNLQFHVAIVSFPVLAMASLIVEDGQWAAIVNASWIPWAALAFMVFGANIVGHGGVYYLLQRHDVSRISTMLLLAPCIGVLSGVVLLGEPMSLRIGLGSAITIIGIAVIAMKPFDREKAETGEEEVAGETPMQQPILQVDEIAVPPVAVADPGKETEEAN